MRTLKFRAWCEEDKVMIYDLNSPRLIHGELKDECGQYELMQFTGVQDLHGNDVYDGDIIKDAWEIESYVISWNKTGYWNNLGLVKFSGIIGNIHEHPELLGYKQ